MLPPAAVSLLLQVAAPVATAKFGEMEGGGGGGRGGGVSLHVIAATLVRCWMSSKAVIRTRSQNRIYYRRTTDTDRLGDAYKHSHSRSATRERDGSFRLFPWGHSNAMPFA